MATNNVVSGVDFEKLPSYYWTGENSNVTLVAADGREFKAHQVVLVNKLPRFIGKAGRPSEGRIGVTESGAVVEMMLRRIYGVEWSDVNAEVNIGTEIAVGSQLAVAAGKYGSADLLATNARIGHLISSLTHYKQVIRLVNDYTRKSPQAFTVENLTERLEEVIEEVAQQPRGKRPKPE